MQNAPLLHCILLIKYSLLDVSIIKLSMHPPTKGSGTSYTPCAEGTNLKEGRGACAERGSLNLKGREDKYDKKRGQA